MGRLIAWHIREQLPSYRLGGLFSRTTAHAEGLALELGDVPVLGLQQLIETCDLLVKPRVPPPCRISCGLALPPEKPSCR